MNALPTVYEPGTHVRVQFGRYTDRTGTVTDKHSLLPAREPLLWVRFDGGKERGLIAARFLAPTMETAKTPAQA